MWLHLGNEIIDSFKNIFLDFQIVYNDYVKKFIAKNNL